MKLQQQLFPGKREYWHGNILYFCGMSYMSDEVIKSDLTVYLQPTYVTVFKIHIKLKRYRNGNYKVFVNG